MNRQYRSPYIVNEGKVYRLQPVTGIFDEDWLQNFIFTLYLAPLSRPQIGQNKV
jgi:hypothetical protein